MSEARPPFPPLTQETAVQKVRAAEDRWNGRNSERVSLAYTVDSTWRNRSEFFQGRLKIVEFLTRKWNHELDYRLIKELWAFTGNRIAPTATRIGSPTNTDSCGGASPRSTTCRSGKQTGSSVGTAAAKAQEFREGTRGCPSEPLMKAEA